MKVMIDPNLPDHRKLWKLSQALEMEEYAALGLLVTLWCRVMRLAQTGQLVGWTEREVARASNWKGDPKMLLNAFKSSGLIDDDGTALYIHDWMDEQGHFLEKRVQWRERQKRWREGHAKGKEEPIPTRAGDTVADKLAVTFRTCVGVPISQEKAVSHIQAVLTVGGDAQKIEAAFMDPTNRGKKIWEILEPMRPKVNGQMSTSEALKRWAEKENGK